MSNIDQDFVEYVIKSIVGNPDAVSIERKIDEKGVLLTLTVDPEDLGRVIGKRGATAQSVRTLLRALGTKNDARYNLKIADNGEPRPERQEQDSVAATAGGSWGSDDSSSNDSHSDDSFASSSKPAPEPASEPAEEESAVDRAKKELAELDDLDI